ncbi:hypothetical protein OG729_00855 [Streptomyces sp. NBC_00210]|uniref:hypothetical protein n=1 Tax=Streptomyces sp. NBC_00210 TaxID=2903636 RepID=UPI00324962C0
MATTTKIQPRALVRASGGPRYPVALALDALGTGLLRPFSAAALPAGIGQITRIRTSSSHALDVPPDGECAQARSNTSRGGLAQRCVLG